MRTALSLGANNWNGGELYGTPERNSLHLLNEYFTKYPGDAEKVVLSIKGGLVPGTFKPDGSKEGVQRTLDECLKVLDGKKSLDLFEYARVDPNTPIKETIGYIAEYVKAGKLGGISLSEVGAASIREAHSVHPIAAVEVEFSLWALDILENGVAATCAELGIPIVAYSPLGRGFLVSMLLYGRLNYANIFTRLASTRSIAISSPTRPSSISHVSSLMCLTKTSSSCIRSRRLRSTSRPRRLKLLLGGYLRRAARKACRLFCPSLAQLLQQELKRT
jgi:pyridoxine 4-dehydrogenase